MVPPLLLGSICVKYGWFHLYSWAESVIPFPVSEILRTPLPFIAIFSLSELISFVLPAEQHADTAPHSQRDQK